MTRILIIVVTLFALQGCGGVKRMERKQPLSTSPEKLMLAVDQKGDPYVVQVDYTLNVPKRYVPSCGQLVYSPRFVNQGNSYNLTPIVITGNTYNRVEQRLELLEGKEGMEGSFMQFVPDGKEMQIRMSEKVPFQLWMPESKLIATVRLEGCNKETELYSQTLADGVLYIPEGPGPVIVKYVRKEVSKKEEGFARFYYPVNGYTVDPALHNNRQQLEDMGSLIHRVMNDTAMRVNKIVITGICSPDGAWGYNETLAHKRAEYIRNYLTEHDKISSDLLEAKYVAEDWNGLRVLVNESTLSNKEAILDIIDGSLSDDQKESALKKLPQYNYIKQNFFPQLRKVTYEVFYTVTETEVVPEVE